jgi:hypothetical protein
MAVLVNNCRCGSSRAGIMWHGEHLCPSCAVRRVAPDKEHALPVFELRRIEMTNLMIVRDRARVRHLAVVA